MTDRTMPVLFVGHGSPMNAIEENEYSRAWEKLALDLPRPNGILCVSAHWMTENETLVHVSSKPKTIHDFYGFPKALYEIEYLAPGSPEYAEEARKEAEKTEILPDTDWGLDHGAWSVLRRMYPKADIPVFQVSIDMAKGPRFHYELGQELAALRKQGILIIGSGNIVHNLGNISWDPNAKPFEWAVEFDGTVKKLLEQGDDQPLIEYQTLGPSARLAVPTPDHYFPFLFTLGARSKGDPISFPVQGIANGSISMRAIRWG